MARVLVVDEDPWTQRMVSAVLSHAGHEVELAADGWEALIRSGQATPDLVITDVKLPSTDGWAFAATLRSRRDTADVPIIFLAGFSSDRTPGDSFRPDHDQLLEKPFRLEQLETVVAKILGSLPPTPLSRTASLSPAATAEPTRRLVLSGQLAEFAVSSVLIVLELERKTGVLSLSGADKAGRIAIREGRVIRAQVDGEGPRKGALAVYELLTWTRGRFEFNAGDVADEDEIGASTSFLLLEGARLQDENKRENN